MRITKIFKRKVYDIIKVYRYNIIIKLLDKKSRTILDIGCEDPVFYNRLKKKYKVTIADSHPTSKQVKKEDAQNLSFNTNAFDIISCQEVLEHVLDPVKAIKELKRVAKKQLIITVPYEPFFTLFRFLTWEQNHLWAITPKLLKHYLGKPVYENKIFFKRYYVGVWRF